MAVQMPPLLKDSTGQEIKQAIQGLTPVIPDFISDAFSVERSYSKGDITIYNNNVYEFTANKSAGAWDSTKVTQTTIGAVCTSLNNSLTQLVTNLAGLKVGFNATLGGDVLTIVRAMQDNSIVFYYNSNQPTNRPSGCDWGGYILIKNSGRTNIFYLDATYFATAYNIQDTATSISWHRI